MREIRTREKRRRTPILMLTANALPEHVAAGHAAGADGHITKPFNPEQLLDSIFAASFPARDEEKAVAAA